MDCVVTAAEPGKVFAFEVRPPRGPVQTRWSYEFALSSEGTVLRESFEVLWYVRAIMLLFYGGRRRRVAQLEQGMNRTLSRIKDAAESGNEAGDTD